MGLLDHLVEASVDSDPCEIVVKGAGEDLAPKDVLIQYSGTTSPNKCTERRAWGSGPTYEKITVSNVIFFIDLKITVVEGSVLIVEVLDSDDPQTVGAPFRWLKGPPVDEIHYITDTNPHPPLRHLERHLVRPHRR